MVSEDTFDSVFGDGMTEAYRQMENTARAIIDLIKAGDKEEAILRLEREFWPKWFSEGESQRALAAHNDLFTQEAAPEGAVG